MPVSLSVAISISGLLVAIKLFNKKQLYLTLTDVLAALFYGSSQMSTPARKTFSMAI